MKKATSIAYKNKFGEYNRIVRLTHTVALGFQGNNQYKGDIVAFIELLRCLYCWWC